MILPYFFKRISDNRFLISNMLRQFQFLNHEQFDSLFAGKIDHELEEVLKSKKFLADNIDEVAREYRKLNAGLFSSTSLHIFVLTLACNLRCLYCQAEYNWIENAFMSTEIAKRSVDIALQTPQQNLFFEFQGGEPLLNFKTLKTIIEYTESVRGDKKVSYSLVTNAQAMTGLILDFLYAHDVKISFSIDGIKSIHDQDRPTKDGSSNFDRVNHWFKIAKEKYNNSNRISVLPTITKLNLSRAEEFIDFFCDLEVPYISIRELSPFGRVSKNRGLISYTPEEFLDFYRRCMDYLIKLNLKNKTRMRESMTEIILQKIFGKHVVNYPDLRSPCGAAIGQIAYNWNGDIYTCDEGRMMSNIGRQDFRIGNVFENSYRECIESACEICNSSCIETNPSCSNCVYHPICGICPVYNFFTQNDFVGVPIKQDRCKILRGIFDYVIEWMNCEDESKRSLCMEWGA